MNLFFRPVWAVGCVSVGLLCGCSLTPKHQPQCGACVPPSTMLPLSTYENYTPPPDVKPLPDASPISVSPRNSASAQPGAGYDYFESARDSLRK